MLLLGPEMDFDTGLGKPARVHVLRGVDAHDVVPTTAECESRRLPRAREPQDEDSHRSDLKSR